MFDDSIFGLFFKLIENLFCEVLPRKICGKNKTVLSRIMSAIIIFLLTGLSIITVIVAAFALFFILDSPTNIINSIIILVLSLTIIIVNILLLIILPKYLLEFESFEDEMDFSYKNGFSRHTVILILQQTKNDCFVLAYFCGYLGIRPAVYKKHGKRIGLIEIYKENIYYKTFYLYESDANKNYSVRVYRIKNKLTKTQMIVFASENATLNIRINNTVIPPIVPENKIANFSIYGTVETYDTRGCEEVIINSYKYQLIECKSSKFIGKNEIVM